MRPRETAKERASQIPPDYFRGKTLLDQGRGWWSFGGAALMALAAVASGWLGSEQGQTYYSRGPLASAHASWDDRCTVCHVPYSPISGEAAAWHGFGDSHAADQRCKTCHSGPAHNANQSSAPSCASCHRDHQGREASLVRLPDKNCTQCHEDLEAHVRRDMKGSGFANHVTRFDPQHHPQFRAIELAEDPGKLKFNHKLHMTPGMVLDPNGKPFRYKDIADGQAQKRYWQSTVPSDERVSASSVDVEAAVRLDCVSCHRLDAGDFGVAREQLATLAGAVSWPPRAAGAYMQPITYDNQCKACHPLTFDRAAPGTRQSRLVAVPHRLQPDEVHDFLEGYYAGQYFKGNRTLFERFLPPRLIPGRPVNANVETARQRISRQVASAEKILYVGKKTCGECHHYKEGEIADTPRKIVAPEVPTIWLPHAKFSHTAHRAVSCRECHGGAYEDSKDATDVLLPSRDLCLRCHAPRTRSGSEVRGGADFRCTECHRYHNGDAPLQGFGAEKRGVPEPLRIEDFLTGSRKADTGNAP